MEEERKEELQESPNNHKYSANILLILPLSVIFLQSAIERNGYKADNPKQLETS